MRVTDQLTTCVSHRAPPVQAIPRTSVRSIVRVDAAASDGLTALVPGVGPAAPGANSGSFTFSGSGAKASALASGAGVRYVIREFGKSKPLAERTRDQPCSRPHRGGICCVGWCRANARSVRDQRRTDRGLPHPHAGHRRRLEPRSRWLSLVRHSCRNEDAVAGRRLPHAAAAIFLRCARVRWKRPTSGSRIARAGSMTCDRSPVFLEASSTAASHDASSSRRFQVLLCNQYTKLQGHPEPSGGSCSSPITFRQARRPALSVGSACFRTRRSGPGARTWSRSIQPPYRRPIHVASTSCRRESGFSASPPNGIGPPGRST